MSKFAPDLDHASAHVDGMLHLESYNAMLGDSATTTSHALSDEEALGMDAAQTTISMKVEKPKNKDTRHIKKTDPYAVMYEGPFTLKDYELTMAKYETSVFKQHGISYDLASFVNSLDSRHILNGIIHYKDFGPTIFASSEDPKISNIDLATRTKVLSLEAHIRSGKIKLAARMEARSARVAPEGMVDEPGCKCVVQ